MHIGNYLVRFEHILTFFCTVQFVSDRILFPIWSKSTTYFGISWISTRLYIN